MQLRISQIGTSLGVIIPSYIVKEGGFTKGVPVNIEYADDKIVISKPAAKREGWAAAFAKYAEAGEDEKMLPDELDAESIEMM